MESTPSFLFKTSTVFTPCEMAELYKLFKTIDDTNDGIINYKEIAFFIEQMYTKDDFSYKEDDISQVHAKFNDVHTADKGDYTDFDTFISAFEKWFVITGAIKFANRNQENSENDETWLTEDQCTGFHEIIKAFFYDNNFQHSSKLIEDGREKYHNIEDSILDMNAQGEFAQVDMDDKSSSLERSKELYLSFSEVFNEISSEYSNFEQIQSALNHIVEMFEVLDKIVVDYELSMINPHIHGIFG